MSSLVLRQSTTRTVIFGPFVDSEDGVTPETGLTISQSDMQISKNGGSPAQVSASGKSRSFEFNPYWVRVLFTERPDGGNHLRLASHGRELEFGRLLNDDERRDFADALRRALDAGRMSYSA